jgi:hypothetical protein
MNAVLGFIADETAATAVEYCLIATSIALEILVAVAGIECRAYGHQRFPEIKPAAEPLHIHAAADGRHGFRNADFSRALFLRARRFKVAVSFEGLRRASSMLLKA